MHTITKTIFVGPSSAPEALSIKRLDLDDLDALIEGVKARREQAVKILAEQEKLNYAEKFNAVLDVRQSAIGYRELFALTDSPKFAKQVVTAAIDKSGLQARGGEIFHALGTQGTLDLAKLLVLDEPDAKPEPAKAEEGQPPAIPLPPPVPSLPASVAVPPATSSPPDARQAKIEQLEQQAGRHFGA